MASVARLGREAGKVRPSNVVMRRARHDQHAGVGPIGIIGDAFGDARVTGPAHPPA